MTVVKLRMKNNMILFAFFLSACFSQATTEEETVWLNDMTTRLQTYKRGVTVPDFPDQLSFHFKRKTDDVVLNLERNYLIDPNTDTYVVQRLIDGKPLLEKIPNLEQANVAYYQDVDNGAFMTARCVKRSSGQCDIVINGNIRLGDRSYNLRPSETFAVQNNFLNLMGLRGKRYVLQDQAPIESGMSAQNNDKARQVNNYYVDVVALADLSLWKFFLTIANATAGPNPAQEAFVDLREYLIHIVHGVHQLFSGIEDPSISIVVRIKYFVIYQTEHFPHIHSKVHDHGGKIDGDKYLQDLKLWDIQNGAKSLQDYDQVMLFTRHMLYSGNPDDTEVDGRSTTASVCDIGRRVQIVRVSDFFHTIRTAAHGLGHALGATHDSYFAQYSCKPEDKLIMSEQKPSFYPTKKYTLNPWLFSRCAVEAFKITLIHKRCVKAVFVHDPDIVREFQRVLRTPTGQRFDLSQQCVLRNGLGSHVSRKKMEHICSAMTCTKPGTHQWDNVYLPAATGTICGPNKTCQKGLCVATPLS